MNLLEEYTPKELALKTYKELQERKKKRKSEYYDYSAKIINKNLKKKMK